MTATLDAPAIAPFWRMDDPELDEEGRVIVGGMWEHQREWWTLPNFIRGIVTGYGGGKTISLGKRMSWLSIYNAPVPVITVSPSYPMASTTIVQTLDELLDGKCSLEPNMTYHLFRSQPYRFTITRKGQPDATILCMSGERPAALKGSNVAAAGIDEPFIMPRAVFDQVLARVRHPQARKREINIGGTPEGVVGWGYDLFEGELRKKHDVGLVQCSSRANRALPRDYVSTLTGSFDENAAAAYVEGKFVNLSTGRVYHSFDPTLHVTDAAIPEGAEIGVGMDFNVDPMAFVFFWRKGERMHVYAERERPNCDAEQAAIEIREQVPGMRDVYPDASGNQRSHAGGGGKSAFGYLRDNGFRIHARNANPLLPDRRNAVNGAFRRGVVTIGKDCPKLRSYLLAYTHENSNKTQGKSMSHLLDSFSYPIAYLFPVDRKSFRLVSV
jgi:hypothetical protein